MEIQNFIDNYSVEYTTNRISSEDIKIYENEMNVKMGNELKKYLLLYGYLALNHIEFYGINCQQMLQSDMVKQTKYLHKYFSITCKFIAIENMSDGKYALVSSDDFIYEYSTENDELKNTGLKLFEYIVDRLREAINSD